MKFRLVLHLNLYKALRNGHYKCTHIVDKETNLEKVACNHNGSHLQD